MENEKERKVQIALPIAHYEALARLAKEEERSISATARRIFKVALVREIQSSVKDGTS